MKLPAILISDLHLTANPRDAYRWGLFPWLVEQCRKHKVRTVNILGDLTDAKDYHSALLVNRIADELVMLRYDANLEDLNILMGNHDYLKTGEPFFSFLNHILYLRYIATPTGGAGSLYFPYSTSPADQLKGDRFMEADYVFMHQTVNAAVSENGQAMESVLSGKFGRPVYSGDIHVPQTIGDVTYVGSPYPVKFGDSFKARCILIKEDGSEHDLYFPTIQRATIEISSIDGLSAAKLYAGDQVKIRMSLSPQERGHWDELRKKVVATCAQMEVDLIGLELIVAKQRTQLGSSKSSYVRLTDHQRVHRFIDEQSLPAELLDTGLDIIGG